MGVPPSHCNRNEGTLEEATREVAPQILVVLRQRD